MTQFEHRCGRCQSMLVDVRKPDGSLRRGCAKCERVELVDVVRQIFVLKLVGANS